MIPYIVKAKKNPQNKEVKYYAQVAPVKHIDLLSATKSISQRCTVTEHDVKAVLTALETCIIKNISDGKTVRLGDLGSFRMTLSSRPSATKEEAKPRKIKYARVRFTQSARLDSIFGDPDGLQFKCVNV